MKAKKLALVVLAFAILGVGLWWFRRPTVAMPEKTDQEISAKGAILKGVGCLATIAKGGMGLGL